jgi:hypothetical protein
MRFITRSWSSGLRNVWTTLSVGLTVGVVASVGGVAAANADEGQHLSEARSFLAQYGVDAATQDRLVSKYLQGERWDSMTDVEPTSVREEERADGSYSISYFEDGSVRVSRLERAVEAGSSPIMARGITGCSVSGKQYNGCKIDTWVGVVPMSFYTSYNLSSNTITAAPWGAGWSIWPDCGSSLTYFGKPTSNRAQMNLKATQCATLFTTNFELRVTVSGGKATVSWS